LKTLTSICALFIWVNVENLYYLNGPKIVNRKHPYPFVVYV
jgi:hypothetical protein